MYINMPKHIENCIKRIERNGFEAYIVGGCVRDSIIDKEPNDWDICTSATPKEIKEIFIDEKTIDVGIEHGTVVVLLENEAIEITTFRVDGNYSDGRRPDRVEFTSKLIDDLARRDFTINAIAYNHKIGIIDYFNGVKDIESKVIRCVGEPDKRFKEDSLRIMRALRFMAQLNYKIEEKTLIAIENNKELLKKISTERIIVELNKLILSNYPGDGIKYMLSMNIIPIVVSYLKKNDGKYIYDSCKVKECIKVIEGCPKKLHVRLTVFLYYILKNDKDENSIGSDYNEDMSSLIPKKDIKLSIKCEEILKELHYDNKTIKNVSTLISYYDTPIYEDKVYIKRLLQGIGLDLLVQLIIVKDITKTFLQEENLKMKTQFNLNKMRVELILDEILKNEEAYMKTHLKITGKDLINLGVKEGIVIGKLLDELLEIVIKDPINNDKEKLTICVKEIYKEHKSNERK
jgi:tRNA nucleotidyltransferase (CCA-adding enzyme)